MIELFQFPWSPFCLPQQRILEFSGAPFKLVAVPPQERSLVWKLTRQQYYGVPIVRDGKKVVFETGEDSQVVAKYLTARLKLNLFPAGREGVQSLLWRHIENDVEGATFRLNDIYYRENHRAAKISAADELQYVRFKERKFGRGCIDQWREQKADWLKKLEASLVPFEQMLAHQPFLLGEAPLFVDFDLLGMLDNFLYSGHYQLSKSQPNIRRWHRQLRALCLKV
ncbi:MAG TPA: glutathione S-transferase family protein [Verrucomicrobiae bacterium]|jgi:glutathione S-transferase